MASAAAAAARGHTRTRREGRGLLEEATSGTSKDRQKDQHKSGFFLAGAACIRRCIVRHDVSRDRRRFLPLCSRPRQAERSPRPSHMSLEGNTPFLAQLLSAVSRGQASASPVSAASRGAFRLLIAARPQGSLLMERRSRRAPLLCPRRFWCSRDWRQAQCTRTSMW